MITALRTAFDAILAASSDSARAKALRAGLKCLLSEEPARPSPPKRQASNGKISDGDTLPRRTARKASGRRRGRPPKPVTDPSRVPEPAAAPLSDTEREQLRFLRSADAKMPGLDADLIERAIAGAELVPNHQSKIRAVLIAG